MLLFLLTQEIGKESPNGSKKTKEFTGRKC